MYIPVHKYVTSFSKASSRKLLFAMKRLINYIEWFCKFICNKIILKKNFYNKN